MKVVDGYVHQAVYNSGTAVVSRHDTIFEAMAAHNAACSAGVQGSAIFTDEGDDVTAYGEGAALVFDKSSVKKINPAPTAKT